VDDAEIWVRSHVTPTAAIEVVHERPWSTVARVPTGDGPVWFKACAPVQAFEARLSAELSARWPDRVAVVLAHDAERAWLLLADAGTRLADLGSPPEVWLDVLPPYAELQRGEAAHAGEHAAHGVPDLRLAELPARYDKLVDYAPLPVSPADRARLRAFAPRFAELCAELAAAGIDETIQHDDLHMWNVYGRRVLDWGDSSVAHPFFSLVVNFKHLEGKDGVPPGDPLYARLRDAYLEPWGPGLQDVAELAFGVGTFAYVIANMRQREHLPHADRAEFDRYYAEDLLRAVALTQ
jgi:hypothetical protein